MTTMLAARDALALYVNTALTTDKPDWPLFWDNLQVPDLEHLSRFVGVVVEFVGGRQATLGPEPIHRRFGVLKFHIGVREYAGRREQIGLMDYVAGLAETRSIGGVTLKSATPQPGVPWQGFDVAEVWIPFETDNR